MDKVIQIINKGSIHSSASADLQTGEFYFTLTIYYSILGILNCMCIHIVRKQYSEN